MLYSMRLQELVVAAMLAGRDSSCRIDGDIMGAFPERKSSFVQIELHVVCGHLLRDVAQTRYLGGRL